MHMHLARQFMFREVDGSSRAKLGKAECEVCLLQGRGHNMIRRYR